MDIEQIEREIAEKRKKILSLFINIASSNGKTISRDEWSIALTAYISALVALLYTSVNFEKGRGMEQFAMMVNKAVLLILQTSESVVASHNGHGPTTAVH